MNPDPDELAAWLRLTGSAEVTPAQWRLALAALGSPQAVLGASLAHLTALIGRDAARTLRAAPHASLAQSIESAVHWCAHDGNHCITLGDARYPAALLEIPDPPALLFSRGDVALLNEPLLALLAARTPSREGLLNARQFARALAAEGVPLLFGDDDQIPWTTINGRAAARVRGVLVLEKGFGTRARPVADDVGAPALCVSEITPGSTPGRVARGVPDRLLAGLARAVLVIEAGIGSSPLATARLAAEFGRDVLAIPGSIHSPLSKGCHRLIKQGARLVESVADVLDEVRRFRDSKT